MGTGDTLRQSSAGKKGSRKGKTKRSTIWTSSAQVAGTVVSAVTVVVAIFAVHQSQVAIKTSTQAGTLPLEDSTGDTSHQSSAGKKGNQEEKIERSTIRASWAQVAGTVISAIAVIVAILVGQAALQGSDQAATRQSEDSELSTAMTAIGSGDAAARTAGLRLLADNTVNRILHYSEAGEKPAEVYDNYVNALAIFSSYLFSHSQAVLTAVPRGSFGYGYGRLSFQYPPEISYAADQLNTLLNMQSEVLALQPGTRPGIDLSNDELYGQYWSGINFSWVFAYLQGIDLRGADLRKSQWNSNSDLERSFLQCSDLGDASFRGADLKFADLNGAYVQGADFRGADLSGARIEEVYGTAKWSKQPAGMIVIPTYKWRLDACLTNSSFWSGQPPAISSPAASGSP
jgi:hypothetical protein